MNIELKLGMDVYFGRIQLMAKNDGIEACQFFSKNIFRNFPMGIHAKFQLNIQVFTQVMTIFRFFI